MTSYNLDTAADELAVRFSYLFILGRAPEDAITVTKAALAKRSVSQLRNDTFASNEWQSMANVERIVSKKVIKELMIDTYLRCRSEMVGEVSYSISDTSEEFIMLQTSDKNKYLEILNLSAKFNKYFARRHGMKYRQFVGIKRGVFPHHAMFNRTHMLLELVESNYAGWVLYVDADALVTKIDFDIRGCLRELRKEQKCMLLHGVHSPSSAKFKWFHINDGCFAIDLSSSVARSVVRAWAGIYKDIYSIEDYKSSKGWQDEIAEDQWSLSQILRRFDMQDHVVVTDIQGSEGFVQQVLRSNSDAISGDEEMMDRVARLSALGYLYYKDAIAADELS